MLLSATVVLFAAACGGSDSDSEPAGEPSSADTAVEQSDDAPSTGDGSTYRGELEDGSTLTVYLDVDESDPIVAPFAAFRELAGVTDPVVWVTGSIEVPADYDDSTGPATGRFLTFVPAGGEVISDTNVTSSFACGELDEWFGAPSGDDAQELNDAYLEILGDSCDGQSLGVIADTGATTDYAMVIDSDVLPDFDSVFAGLLTELQPV